jgi:sterol desaturase/sphingolipid hydroxylase (fatty acid hydroxylase superfamily)
MQALGVMLLTIGVVLSVRERKYRMMWRSSQPTSNQLATVLSQLVGTAGGIYLSLELLFSFLKIPEDWWSKSVFFVEPLAVFSLLLAILQPFGLRVWTRLRK